MVIYFPSSVCKIYVLFDVYIFTLYIEFRLYGFDYVESWVLMFELEALNCTYLSYDIGVEYGEYTPLR